MRKKAFQAAFPYTIPIFAGFWFLALAYGIYMNANGFPFVCPMLMSLLIYGGSLEFVAVEITKEPKTFRRTVSISQQEWSSVQTQCRPVPLSSTL